MRTALPEERRTSESAISPQISTISKIIPEISDRDVIRLVVYSSVLQQIVSEVTLFWLG
jgi:hypothetical protein